MNENLYNILEIPETAGIDEIKKSYRRLSMIYHPDKNSDPDATAKFQKISEAYETLGDPERKREYDMSRNNPFIKMMSSGNGMHGFNPMDDIISNLFGMHMGGGIPFGPEGGIRIFHNGIPINVQHQFNKPTPIVKNITISMDKVLTGTTLPVDIERWIIQDGHKIFENETVYVTIPKGVDDGEMIVLRDKGNILREDCKGDIKMFIKIENNTDFKRNGLDLIYEKSITVKEALCGFTFELKYITGKVYIINNNSGNIIHHDYNKIIPNMGFSREQHHGNLIIVFKIIFPDKLSDEVINQLKQIAF